MPEPEHERQAPRLRIPGLRKDGQPVALVTRAIIATVALVLFGALLAPSTVSSAAVMTMLPFAAVLAVSSIGQHIVIQQRGLDLSTAGIISFAAVMVTAFPNPDAGVAEVLLYSVFALAMGMAVGAVNGLLIAILRVPSLVTTLGMNSLMLGLTMHVSGGFAHPSPPPLGEFGISRPLGVPATIYVMLVFAAIAIFIVVRTGIGRRFIATSVNPAAAIAVGIRLNLYGVVTYMLAGFCYAAAGILLAGYVQTPTVFSGMPYLLATIAAVVIGGNSIGGGERGSVASTVVGALFLTYLGTLVLSLGFGTSARNIVEALIIIGAIALPELTRRLRPA